MMGSTLEEGFVEELAYSVMLKDVENNSVW